MNRIKESQNESCVCTQSNMYIIHCTVIQCYTVQCTLYTVQCTSICALQLYSVLYIHTVCNIFCNIPCTLYNIQFTQYTVHRTQYTVHNTLHRVHCSLYSVHYSLYRYTVHYTVHTVQYRESTPLLIISSLII